MKAFDASELPKLELRLRFEVRKCLINEIIGFQLEASSPSLKPPVQIQNLKNPAPNLKCKAQGPRLMAQAQALNLVSASGST